MSHTNLKTINSVEINNSGPFRVGDQLTSGTSGQVLKSLGESLSPEWSDDTDTTYQGSSTINIDTGTTPDTINVLKVPNALTFTGTSTGTFDGSSALSINLTDSDNQLNLTAALPVVINNGGGLNREVALDIDTATMGVSGGELEVLKVPGTLTINQNTTLVDTFDGSINKTINLEGKYSAGDGIEISGHTIPVIEADTDENTISKNVGGAEQLQVLKVPNTLTFTGSSTGTFDGSSALSINLTDTTYTVAGPITLSAGNEIGLEIDGNTIFLDGAELAVAKVPSTLTFTGTDTGTFDGSSALSINLTDTNTQYTAGTNLNLSITTFNLDTSITGQTGITFLNSGAATNLTGSNYPGKPTTATNLDLTDTSNIISPYFFHDVYDPSSTTGQTLTTSYIQIFSGNLKNTFTAKATSCCIEIIVMSYTVSSNRWLYLQLGDNKGTEWSAGSYSDGGGTGTGTRGTGRLVHYPDETDRQIVTQTWYLQGLTIGNTYTINPQAKTSSTTNQLWTGGIWPACICRGYYLPS